MRPQKRDPAFLAMAAVAGVGGVLAIVLSIAFPIVARMRGHNVSPAFSLFSGWGVAALGGAYACWKTYWVSIDPNDTPRGGARLALLENTNVSSPQRDDRARAPQRAA